MSQQFYVVVNQVLVFGILMLIGYVMAKAKVLTADVLNGLSKLIVKLLLPCLIFYLIIGNGHVYWRTVHFDEGWVPPTNK